MHLTGVVTKAELVHLVESLTPLRIDIDERRGRFVTLGRPDVELVAGRGMRLRGDGRLSWDVAGVAIPMTLQAWQVLLVPRIASRRGSRVLAFEPIVEELDLKLVPAFFDDAIAGAIRGGISQNRDRIAWNFARTLSKRLPLSARLSPSKTFEIVATDGQVEVTITEVRLTIHFEARVETRSAASTRDSDGAAASAPLASARMVR